MNNQKICATFNQNLKYITSITFNGLHFICVDSCSYKVILLDRNFNIVNTINVKHTYSSIYFDNIENCYWAISNNDASIIYQLNSHFEEINHIYIKNIRVSNAIGISYDYYEKKIYILFPNSIGYVKPGSNNMVYIHSRCKTIINSSILSLPDFTVVSYKEECDQYIEIFDSIYCENFRACIPKDYTIKDICLISCSQNRKECFKEFNICLLLYQNCSNKIGIINFQIKSYENKYPNLTCEKWEDMDQDHNCSECDEVKNCHKHDQCFKECYHKSKNEIIQSIALEEAGIAHILNAEGEKIQKAVALYEDIDKLLCVNESVKQMIDHITQLETQLYFKLEAILKCDECNICCKDHCETDCDCICCEDHCETDDSY